RWPAPLVLPVRWLGSARRRRWVEVATPQAAPVLEDTGVALVERVRCVPMDGERFHDVLGPACLAGADGYARAELSGPQGASGVRVTGPRETRLDVGSTDRVPVQAFHRL